MSEGQFLCSECGLMQGDPDSPMLPSQPCASCKSLRQPRAFDPHDDAVLDKDGVEW